MKVIGYLALLAWLFLGFKYYTDYKAGCNANTAIAGNGFDNCPFCFTWGSDEASVCDDWDNIRDEFISTLGDNDRIEIRAFYNPVESADTELGRNRAIYIKSLFNKVIDENRIIFNVKKDALAEHNSCTQRASYNILSNNPARQDQNSIVILHSGGQLDQESKTILDEVYDRLIDSNEKITIIGHTADSNNKVRDLQNGLSRANNVRAYLLEKGLNQQKIIVMSKGANQPITTEVANNNKNNRTQLIFTKDS